MSAHVLFPILLLAADGPRGGSATSTGALRLGSCHLHGVVEAAQCGAIDVPAKLNDAASRRLTIRFARIPAKAREARPDPLFILAGGPGQSAQDSAVLVPRFFKDVRRFRDVVLVDVRGTGASHPLRCAPDPRMGAAFGAALHSCRKELPEDLSPFTTENQMRDVDAVRAHLGYERINLWGGSFGTRAALVYARMFEDRVRSVVLDGAVPLEHIFPVATAHDGQAAMTALLEACGSDKGCSTNYPDLSRALEGLVARLSRTRERAVIADPVTGHPTEWVITKDIFVSSLKLMLYTPQHSRLIPLVIHRAALGDFRPLLAATEAGLAWTRDAMALGTTMQLGCAEDFFRAREAGALALVSPAGSFLGDTDIATFGRSCASFTPVASDTRPRILKPPALVLSGSLDPVTPPLWGEKMRANFKSSAHVVVKGGFHGVSFTGCVPDLIARFIDNPSPSALDASCVGRVPRPHFVPGRSAMTHGGGLQ
jgi:pimeloyl-ACP methyl ester carboxylesterase